MAKSLFDTARQGFLDGSLDLDTATIKIALVRSYTFNAAHQFISDVTGAGGTLVGSQTLGSKTVTNGVFDAADTTFPSVSAGAPIPGLLIYQSSAVGGGADVAATAQRVIAYIDDYTGMPFTPTGVDIIINYDNGANKIFKI